MHLEVHRSLRSMLDNAYQGAGTLRRAAGAEEQVAVKVIDLTNVTPQQAELAQRELRTMAAVSRALAGYVLRLRGFCERDGQLLLAVELADETLAASAARVPAGALTRHAGCARLACRHDSGGFLFDVPREELPQVPLWPQLRVTAFACRETLRHRHIS
jgi:hypothetical protein